MLHQRSEHKSWRSIGYNVSVPLTLALDFQRGQCILVVCPSRTPCLHTFFRIHIPGVRLDVLSFLLPITRSTRASRSTSSLLEFTVLAANIVADIGRSRPKTKRRRLLLRQTAPALHQRLGSHLVQSLASSDPQATMRCSRKAVSTAR